MVERAWLNLWAERLARDLAVAIAAELTPRGRRLRRAKKPPAPPPQQDWPARFATREEWVAWKKQDDEDEMRELQWAAWTATADTLEFEARMGMFDLPLADVVPVRRAA